MSSENYKGSFVDVDSLPRKYPTHRHDDYFWECLGRTVGTFGFLEGVLTQAIFALTATTKYSDDEIESEYEKWILNIERSLSDQLYNLIEKYGKAVRLNQDAKVDNLDELIANLKSASEIRNVICHGSWRCPDKNGATIPFYVNKKNMIFKTPIDVNYLCQVQKHTSELICSVINSVTQTGWQFPGTNGPGRVIWESSK